MCLVSVKLFIIRTILCATIQTSTTYTTIITTETIRTLFLSAYNILTSQTCTLLSHDYSPLCLYMCITILVYPFFRHACCYWFNCIVFNVFVIVQFVYVACCMFAYYYSHTDVVGVLLVASSSQLLHYSFCLIFLMLNDIKSFRFV